MVQVSILMDVFVEEEDLESDNKEAITNAVTTLLLEGWQACEAQHIAMVSTNGQDYTRVILEPIDPCKVIYSNFNDGGEEVQEVPSMLEYAEKHLSNE